MPRKNDSLLNLLTTVPWWVSVVLSALVFIALRYIIPSIDFQNNVLKMVAVISSRLSHLIAIVLLLPAPISLFNSWRKRKMLDNQKNLDSIRALSWKNFEELIGEAYRRQGYRVIENQESGPDGGIDLILKKDGNTFLVQCKQWRAHKVGVKIIREMYGVMAHKQATGIIIVTSGFFTKEAKNFAQSKPIDLVDGNKLSTLIESVQKNPQGSKTSSLTDN